MHHRIFLHLVWATRDRAPLIDLPTAKRLHGAIPAIARLERAQVRAIGIVSTHIHVLVRVHPTVDIPRLVQRMKGGTSVRSHLKWTAGYYIESTSMRNVPQVEQYLRTQHLHHPDQAIVGWPEPLVA